MFLDVLTFFMGFRGTSKSLDSQRSKHIVTPSVAHLLIYKIKKHYKRINDVSIYSFSKSLSVPTLTNNICNDR
jgi:ribosomal protein L30E